MILLLEKILPFVAVVMALVLIAIVKKISHPSPLVWGRILPDLGPVRAHQVLGYNEQIEGEEPSEGRLGREARRRNFAVNWGYLRAGVTNTVLFQRALLFEKDTIDARKPGSEYTLSELATLELLDEVKELRWDQVRCQLILQLRTKLRLKVDREVFLTLFARYKVLEEHMIGLAGTKGKWLEDMMMERLGLTEWGLIEGGRSDLGPA
jgi:hypothetical protein